MDMYYILDVEGKPQPTDALTMGKWFAEDETNRRRLACDRIGELKVSTVFLGLNHQWNDGPPLLWETMVFGLSGDEEIMLRYTSKVDALDGHRQMCDEMLARTAWYKRWLARLFSRYPY